MKILFLDIDGVINQFGEKPTPQNWVEDKYGERHLVCYEPEKVYMINLITDRTGAKVVISSSWRHMPDWEECMKVMGILNVIDRTPKYSDHKKYGCAYEELSRGHNIQDWLDEHDVERYAIIDDSSDMLKSQLPNLFRTSEFTGITQDIADNIEKHLHDLSPPSNGIRRK